MPCDSSGGQQSERQSFAGLTEVERCLGKWDCGWGEGQSYSDSLMKKARR